MAVVQLGVARCLAWGARAAVTPGMIIGTFSRAYSQCVNTCVPRQKCADSA